MQAQQPLAVNPAPAFIPADPGKRIVALLIDMAALLLVSWIPLVNLVAIVGWQLCRDLVFGGQSPGKKVMGLKVVDYSTGQVPSSGALVGRNAVFFIPCFGLVELIVYFTSKDKRRLGDQWTNCIVVAQ